MLNDLHVSSAPSASSLTLSLLKLPVVTGMYEVYVGQQGRAAEVLKLRHQQADIRHSESFADISTAVSVRDRAQLVSHICKGDGQQEMM